MNKTGMVLDFATLDGLEFAAQRSMRYEPVQFVAADIGPIVELMQLSSQGLLPSPSSASWLRLQGATHFCREIERNQPEWICPLGHRLGFLRTSKRQTPEATWTRFGMAVQKAAIDAGFPPDLAAQFAAVFGELRSNLYEHSNASETGLLAFQASPGRFELVVRDRGIGILDSLRTCGEHRALSDHGAALQLALTDGVSRFGTNIGRGRGFRPIFVGLANLNGELRFRSGDHALVLNGKDPSLVSARIAQKALMIGFLVSIVCEAPFAKRER